MRIINRRHLCHFYTLTTTTDTLGQRVRDWSTQPIASVMCEVKQESSIESGVQREVLESKVTIEFRPAVNVKPEMKAVLDGVDYWVETVYPIARTRMRVDMIKRK